MNPEIPEANSREPRVVSATHDGRPSGWNQIDKHCSFQSPTRTTNCRGLRGHTPFSDHPQPQCDLGVASLETRISSSSPVVPCSASQERISRLCPSDGTDDPILFGHHKVPLK